MNNNFNNNMFPNNGYGYGYAGTTPQEPIAMNTPLTPEDIESLRHTEQPVFGKKLNKDEYLRAICTHKDPHTGNFTLRDNNDGTFTCSICKSTFRFIEPSETTIDQVESICDNFADLFESIKTMYGPIPPETAKDLYSILGFVKKIPKMYEIAGHYFQKLTPGSYAQSNYGTGIQNQLWNLMGGMGFGQPQFQQQSPFQGQPQQPQFQNQGAAQNFGFPTQPQTAPMGMGTPGYYPGNPNQAYAPAPNNTNPMGYVEQGVQIPVKQAPQNTVQSSQTVTSPDVNASFKG